MRDFIPVHLQKLAILLCVDVYDPVYPSEPAVSYNRATAGDERVLRVAYQLRHVRVVRALDLKRTALEHIDAVIASIDKVYCELRVNRTAICRLECAEYGPHVGHKI